MDSIDFYTLLNAELGNITNNNIINNDISNNKECLITYEPLKKYYITLECGHTFNYLPIIKEVYNQKYVHNNYEVTRLGKYQIKCPYCRNIQNSLLPQSIFASNVIGVNSPYKYCMKLYSCTYKNKLGNECERKCFGKYCVKHHLYTQKINSMNKCSHILSSGKRKGEMCGILTEQTYCKRHLKSLNNMNNKKNDTSKITEKCVAILKSGKRNGEECGCIASEISPVKLCKRHMLKKNKPKHES